MNQKHLLLCCSFQSFQEGLLYNPETKLFEVASDEAELVSRTIGSVLRRSKSLLLTGDPAGLGSSPPVDNRYSVTVRLLLFTAMFGTFLALRAEAV